MDTDSRKLFALLFKRVNGIGDKVDRISTDAADMQPRVKMLNDWHNDVNEWRGYVDGKLRFLGWMTTVGTVAAVGKFVLDAAQVAGWIGR